MYKTTELLPNPFHAIPKSYNPQTVDPFHQLIQVISPLCDEIVSQPVYKQLSDRENLHQFLQSHTFTLWTSLNLLRTTYERIHADKIPWLTGTSTSTRQLIADLASTFGFAISQRIAPMKPEETHYFQLYLQAMDELGVDNRNIFTFLHALDAGLSLNQAINDVALPGSLKTFMATTLALSCLTLPEVAALLLWGREVISEFRFQTLLNQVALVQGIDSPSLRTYMQRHLDLERRFYQPIGYQILQQACGQDQRKWKDAQCTAILALKMRRSLGSNIPSA